MDEHQRLLDEARRFCDPVTGEVVERIPEELMRRLRASKLAVGISGAASQTATSAKWIVFLDDRIRDQALTLSREAKRKRQRNKPRPADALDKVPASDAETPANTKSARGLRGFLRPRKSDQ
jgi:hypothetical protein